MVHGPKCIGLNLRAFGCDGSCDGLSVHVVRFNPHFVVPFKTVFAFAVGLSVFGFAFGLTVFAFALGFPAFAFALGFGTAFSFGTVFGFGTVFSFGTVFTFCFFAGGGLVAVIRCGEALRRTFVTCSSRSA